MHASVVELKCRQHGAELRQSREECWAQGQELAAAREKLSHLKTTLEDRRRDVVSYKVTDFTCIQSVFCVSHKREKGGRLGQSMTILRGVLRPGYMVSIV